ncbi:RAP protein, putative [Plasmodium ovale]|uniref:RAP protein, putative n=1 Tax=Plasmodium ovale TaxID=36330 RepID=A0A1C3KW79_PLAOA|nr:RAP protein, putative [Plasmodium ovale]
MLKICCIPVKVHKLRKLDFEKVKWFVTAKENKQTVNRAIKINKEILKNGNVLEVIRVVKENEKDANIINYVTFVHRLMQLIHSNDVHYLKNKRHINSEIESKIKIIFQHLNDHKENRSKVNNYNKRLFSSFIWSLSKYLCLSKENNNNACITASVKNDLVYCSKNVAAHAKGDLIHSEGKQACLNVLKGNDAKDIGITGGDLFLGGDYNEGTEWERSSSIGGVSDSDKLMEIRLSRGIPRGLSLKDFNLLCHYADIFLPSLNPSRYVLVLWSLGKLNKNYKELHQKFYEKSVRIMHLLKDKELLILLYTYSYVSIENMNFYIKVKNFIMSKNIHMNAVHLRNYKSIVSMLLSFANQNIFFQDLYESTITHMLQTCNLLNSLSNKELITVLFCVCKFPFLYLSDGKMHVTLRRNGLLNKNVLLYELLKKKIMKRCKALNIFKGKYDHTDQRDSNVYHFTTLFNLTKMGCDTFYSLENLILITWSLSQKCIYSAKLFLYIFTQLNELENFKCAYISYDVWTNFYLAFLSFLLEDASYINLYFNREEENALHILYNNINTFIDNLNIFKNVINLHGRKNDIEVSNMQRSIFSIVSNHLNLFPHVTSIMEYKNELNLSVDILLFRKFSSTKGKYFLGENANPAVGILYKGVLPLNAARTKSHTDSYRDHTGKVYADLRQPFPLFFFLKRNACTLLAGVFEKREGNLFMGTLQNKVRNFHVAEKNDIIHTGRKAGTRKHDHITTDLFRFLERIKKLNTEVCSHELEEVHKFLFFYLNRHIKDIKKYDVISFFYKFSSCFPNYYKGEHNLSNLGHFLKIFSIFIEFTSSFLLHVRNECVHLFIDVCWILFRYMKHFRFLLKMGDINKKWSEGLIESRSLLSQELNKTINLFDCVIKGKIINEDIIIVGMSSKNMALLISVFAHLKNSKDIINYLQKNNFHDILFNTKDTLFVLSALSKCDNIWGIEKFFCEHFSKNIKNCAVKDLVEFTYLCAELKITSNLITYSISNRIRDYVTPFLSVREEKCCEKKKRIAFPLCERSHQNSNCRKVKFIETFQQEELALFIRNCYRMHCFDRNFFDFLCDETGKRGNSLSLGSLCVILPCFARIYCLQKEVNLVERKKRKEKNTLVKISDENSDYLERNISICRYNIPTSLKVLVNCAEEKMRCVGKSVNLYNLCYYMESLTLLKIENRNMYHLCIEEAVKKIHTFLNGEKEAKLLGKILWCLSYYHRTEFLFSQSIIHFILKYKIYKQIIPENFISFFLYFIKSRVYNEKLFRNMGEVILSSVSLNDILVHAKEKRKNVFKLNVVSELHATMAWAYAFTYSSDGGCDDGSSGPSLCGEEEVVKGEYKSVKNSCKNAEAPSVHASMEKKQFVFLEKVYGYIFNEIKILQHYRGEVSFLLLARFFWGISVVNIMNDQILKFINAYNWTDIKVTKQNKMHLHMIFTLWLRLKHFHPNLKTSERFTKCIDEIISLFKINYPKKDILQNRIMSSFHLKISHMLDKLKVKYKNEYITEDFLLIDIAIKNEELKEKIAIEIDGPSHHLLALNETHPQTSGNVNKKYVPCGTTYFKNSLLKKNGWTIIHIPSYKWNKLKREEKDAYLIHKLSSCSEHLKNYFEKYNKLV